MIENDGGHLTPRPDPTLLTTQQLLHEIEHVKDLVFMRIEGHEKEAVERFNGINRQLLAIQHLIEQRDIDRKSSVEAAFSAAEKAVEKQTQASAVATLKSESAMTKQIDQIGALIATTSSAINNRIEAVVVSLNDKIDDAKSRLTQIEGSGKGSKDLLAILFTVVGIGVALTAAIIAYSKVR